jgi:hypothetical protein
LSYARIQSSYKEFIGPDQEGDQYFENSFDRKGKDTIY